MSRVCAAVSARIFPVCGSVSFRSGEDLLHNWVVVGASLASSRSHPDSMSLEDFLRHFERIFDRPNFAGCAGDRLFIIWQGARLVGEYTVEFETLAEESSFNEPALLVAFRRGLNEQVRDALVMGACPRDLGEMIDRPIELDNFQRERRHELPPRPMPPRSPMRRASLHRTHLPLLLRPLRAPARRSPCS